jgi:hypothetical protein
MDFHPGGSPRSQSNAFNKATVTHNQLRSDIGFSTYKFRLWISRVLSPSQADAAAPNHKSPSQSLLITMTPTTITSSHISASMPFSMTDFIMGLRHVPRWKQTAEFRIALSETNWSEKTWLRDWIPPNPAIFGRVLPNGVHRRCLPELDFSARSTKHCSK